MKKTQKILALNWYAVDRIQNTNQNYELFPSNFYIKIY